MDNNKCIIYDSFDNELENLDIVVACKHKTGFNECEIGIYYNTYVVMFEEFDKRGKINNSIVVTKYPMFGIYGDKGLVDRYQVETGIYEGNVKIKAVIKMEQPSESMLFLRYNMLNILKQNGTQSSIPRKTLNMMISDAEKRGII